MMRQKKNGKSKLLLLEDVRNLGRKGELATAKAGFVRNYLLPEKKAVLADKRTIRMQEQLQKERAAQSLQDKKESEAVATRLKEKTLSITVKNDPQGHLYGSVAAVDIVRILEEQESLKLERKNIILSKPFKTVGVFDVELRLKEDVPATFKLKIEGETKVREVKSTVKGAEEGEAEPLQAEDIGDDATEELPLPSQREKEIKEELDERSKE